MLTENIKPAGSLQVQVFDQFGNLKEETNIKNLVVNAGLAFVASRLKDTTQNAMTHMAVGTGTTAAAAAQTDLVAVAASGRKTLDSTTLVTTNVANDTIQYVATFQAGFATGALTEAGMFNALTGGTMMCRTVFSVINKGPLDSMTITWKVVFA